MTRAWQGPDATTCTKVVNSAKDTAFEFHRDGTVTGRLGCNDFTAKAFFNGPHVFFRDARLNRLPHLRSTRHGR
ncbi:META domain-containing protein [Streptomyces angustmyceticus]